MKNMQVLVVDDSMYIRNLVKNSIKDIEIDIFEADNGKTALSVLREEEIDIVFLDWNMPVLSGLEVVKKVSQTEIWGNVYIVMVTSEAAKYNIMEALEAGVNEYLIKPITPIVIQETFNKFIKSKDDQ